MFIGYEGWMVAGMKKACDFNITVDKSDNDTRNNRQNAKMAAKLIFFCLCANQITFVSYFVRANEAIENIFWPPFMHSVYDNEEYHT